MRLRVTTFKIEYVLPVIKAHRPSLFQKGMRAKDVQEISIKMGFPPKVRGTFEDKINRLVERGVLKDSGTKVGGCTVFAIVDKRILKGIKGMRVRPWAKEVVKPKVSQPKANVHAAKAVGMAKAEVTELRLEEGRLAKYYQDKSVHHAKANRALYIMEKSM